MLVRFAYSSIPWFLSSSIAIVPCIWSWLAVFYQRQGTHWIVYQVSLVCWLSLKTLTRVKTLRICCSAWWVPVGLLTTKSASTLSIISFRTPIDWLTLCTDCSDRFGPRPFRNDFRKLFMCSRWRSRGTFLPFPPLLFQNLFHVTLWAMQGLKEAFTCSVSRKVL